MIGYGQNLSLESWFNISSLICGLRYTIFEGLAPGLFLVLRIQCLGPCHLKIVIDGFYAVSRHAGRGGSLGNYQFIYIHLYMGFLVRR